MNTNSLRRGSARSLALGLLLVLACGTLHGQSRVSWGVRSEANLSGFIVRQSNVVFSHMRPGATLGVELPCGVQIQVGYRVDVVNVLDANRSLLTLLPHSVSIGVGYRFGQKRAER